MAEEEIDFEVGEYVVAAAVAYGPRIIGLRLRQGPQLLVRLGTEVVLEHPQWRYTLRGGHRLWAAPEVPEVTYAPDDLPCAVTQDEKGFTVSGPLDGAGLTKEIAVSDLGTGCLTVDHKLTNGGEDTLVVAPWAITQFPPGGIALLPYGRPGGEGLQADRSVVLWPYTNPADSRVTWRKDTITLEAATGPAIKLGVGPDPAHVGYLRAGHLFLKVVPAAIGDAYADRGAVAQVYMNEDFCELESVGALVTLAPGDSVSHEEEWSVMSCPDVSTAQRLISRGTSR